MTDHRGRLLIAALVLSLSCGPEYLAALYESGAELIRQGRYREALLIAVEEAECLTSDLEAPRGQQFESPGMRALSAHL